MIKTKCFADVSSTMNARDMEAIKRGVKERVDAGTVKLATIRAAEIGAVQDLLADIDGERAELMKLAREQHADVFAAPVAEDTPKEAASARPSAEAQPSEPSSTPNNVGVSEPSASEYSAAKPYEKDLFGSPVSSPSARALGDRTGQPSAKAGDVATAASVSAPEGRYATRAALVTTREQKLGYAGQVTDLAGAANALAYLNKSAVERLDGLVTDAKGTPLAIIGGFKGALSQAAVYPATILGEAMQVPGAANLWLVHNHPSGSSTLSRADGALAQNIAGVFDGTGVQVRGMLAVTSKEWSGSWDADNFSESESGSISPTSGPTIPAQERQIVEDGKLGPAIESPRAAKDLVASLVQQNMGRPTIVLLDAQHNPVAAIPWAPEDALPMKGNGKLDALFRAIAQSNAGTALIGTGGTLATGAPVMSDAQAQNLGAALHKADVRVLDIIDRNGESASEQGHWCG